VADEAGLERALAAQEALVAAGGSDPVAWNDLGNLHGLAGEFGEAEAAYRRAIALDDHQTSARFNLALLLMQRGQNDEAAERLEQVLALDPEDAWAYYQLGILVEARGERERAIDLYAHAFALDPTLTFAESNPHIIDNHLVTPALLTAQRYVKHRTASQVPRQYGDGGRIAALMLRGETQDAAPQTTATAPEGPTSNGQQAPENQQRSPGQQVLAPSVNHRETSEQPATNAYGAGALAGEDESAGQSESSEPGRVLTSEDLDANSHAGEAVGGRATRGARTPGAVFNRYRPPQNAQPNARTPNARTPNAPAAGGGRRVGGVVPVVPASPGANAPRANAPDGPGAAKDRQGEAERGRSERFRPLQRSSAQLDLVLEPIGAAAG